MGSWWHSQLPNILEMLKECSLTRPWYQNSSLPQQTMVSSCHYFWLCKFILCALLVYVACIAHAFLHDTCTIHALLLKSWHKNIIIQMYSSLAQFKRSILNIQLHVHSVPVYSILYLWWTAENQNYFSSFSKACWIIRGAKFFEELLIPDDKHMSCQISVHALKFDEIIAGINTGLPIAGFSGRGNHTCSDTLVLFSMYNLEF